MHMKHRTRTNIRLALRRKKVLARIMVNYIKLMQKKLVLRQADIAITFDCQLGCKHCSISMLKKEKQVLSLEQVNKVIWQLKKLGVTNINFTGGEPLLKQDVYDMIKFAHSQQMFTSILSNGFMLTDDNVRKLKKSGIDMLIVSIDSADAESHDDNRGKDSFNRVIKGISYAKAHKMEVMIDAVITPDNISDGDIKKQIKLAKELGVLIQLNVPCAVGKWAGKDEKLLSKDDQKYFRELLKEDGVRTDRFSNYLSTKCPAAVERIFITAYGDVLPCPFIHISFGNFLKEPLGKIWKRMLNSGMFSNNTELCLAGEDREFIEKHIKPTYDSGEHPYKYDEDQQ